MRILIAPDSFKEALDAEDVAAALAEGVRAARPDAEVDCCPLGDGGEGSARILARACGAEELRRDISGPRGRRRMARWWRHSGSQTAYIELAEAAGLALLSPAERDPLRTTTYGVGELLQCAVDRGCKSLLLCVGGSATVDGGAGCLQALGCRFHNATGDLIDEPLSGGRLRDVARIDVPSNPIEALTVLCDVDNPLIGPEGAAPVFAPQKGADAATVRELAAALDHWANVLNDATGRDVRTIPHGGAAGGIAAGLHAALGAQLVPGFHAIAERLCLRDRVARADLVLTGEGRFDAQTARGKVVAGVARLAQSRGVPAVALVGAADGDETARKHAARRLGLRDVCVITPSGTKIGDALAETRANLYRAARALLEGEGAP